MQKLKDDHRRSVAKAITWRIVASLSTMSIVQVFTGKWALSVGVGVVEVIWKMGLYYFHERAWGFIDWGTPHPLADLPVTKELTDKDKAIIRKKLEDLGYL